MLGTMFRHPFKIREEIYVSYFDRAHFSRCMELLELQTRDLSSENYDVYYGESAMWERNGAFPTWHDSIHSLA